MILGTSVDRGHALEFQIWSHKQNSNGTGCHIRITCWGQWKQRSNANQSPVPSAHTPPGPKNAILTCHLSYLTLPQSCYKSLHCLWMLQLKRAQFRQDFKMVIKLTEKLKSKYDITGWNITSRNRKTKFPMRLVESEVTRSLGKKNACQKGRWPATTLKQHLR